MSRFFSTVARVPQLHPFKFGVGLSAVKTLAQKYLEGRETLDRRRSLVFLAWGAIYLGGVQYGIYVVLFARHLFPSAGAFLQKPVRERLADRAGQAVVLKQVALDQFVHHPFMLFPCFYTVKEFIEQGTLGAEQLRSAMGKYAANLREDCVVCWSTWVPAFLVNFSLCPLWLRVPFVATVSMGFMTYFSFLRGPPQKQESSS